MKNILRIIGITISCLYLTFNCYGQSSGLTLELISPLVNAGASLPDSVVVSAKNTTASNVNSFTLSYYVNGILLATESYNSGIINPGDSVFFTFITQFIVPQGSYDVCVSVDSVNGSATLDTSCFALYAMSQNGYIDNLEGVVYWQQAPSPIGNTQWELGMPNYGTTNSAHSGIKAWDINLNSAYGDSATTYLTSAVFDLSTTINAQLSFWLNYNTELHKDGLSLEYSVNGGTWTTLGNKADPLGLNWFTDSTLSSSGNPGWTGNSGGWIQCIYNASILNFAGAVQFRFVFTSDSSGTSDGVSIDDFSFLGCGLTVTPTINNFITCNGACDGVLSCAVTGGTAPYQYIWSIGTTTQTISSLCAGTYTILIIDANGCSATSTITLTQAPPISVLAQEAYNCLTGNDSVYITPTGGIPPYIYNWSNGTTAFYLSNPLPGVYTVNVTDINGCTASGSITVIGSLNLSLTKVDPDCYGYPSSMSAAMNGVPPLTYLWSNGVTVPQLVNPPGGTYTVTVTDVNGCSLSATDSIVEPPPVVLTLDSVIPSGCGASNGAFYYSFTPSAFSIPWINGVQFATSTNLPKGAYNIYIVQNVCASNTVTVVVPDSCADVWPGDANYDLVADNKDLLQIGLAYGNTGPVRPSASNTWIAQSCTDWSSWFNIGVNQKHADCDGNGVIDAADTIPILANYGLTHLLKPVIIPQVNTLAPDLYLVITQDTTGLSDSVFISVMCGTATDPVDSIYGLAFTLYYDSALVDTSSVYFDYSNSFLGTAGVNLISINKNFGVGYADFAITRTDHTNASGHGPVAVMGIVTTDNVAGKMLNPVNTTLQFSLGNVYALTANENPITLDAFGDSIFLDSNLTGLNYLNWDGAIKVYPNPASNYLVVASSLTNISKISILNQLGEIVYNNQKPRLPQNINVAAIPNGVYVLRIETKEGVMHRKVQIIK